MNIKETSVILEAIRSAFPSRVNDSDKEKMLSLWSAMFCETPYEEVAAALKTFIATNTSGFPPTIGQLNAEISKLMVEDMPSAENAWGLVRDAISNGIYNSKDEFENLPPLCQRAVGSPSQIQDWAMSSYKELNIARTMFINKYNSLLADESVMLSLSNSLKKQRDVLKASKVQQLADGMLKRIGDASSEA